jgi:competence protein ComEC
MLGGLSLIGAAGSWLLIDRPRSWMLCWTLSGLALATVFGALRDQHPTRWAGLPPREAELEIAVTRMYPPRPGYDSWSGLGKVTATAPHLADLRGQLVHFALRSEANAAPPIRSERIAVIGVLRALSTSEIRNDFEEHLVDSGVRFRLSRAKIVERTSPANGLQRLSALTAVTIETALRAGISQRPDLASVYIAMLLGRKSELSDEQKSRYLQTGTLHLFAISGLHIGVIALALAGGLSLLRAPPVVAAVIGLSLLFLFVQATGAMPSSVRAFTMTTFLWSARLANRPINPLAALAAACAFVLLLEPRQLFTASFQLSFAVVTGILLYGLPLAERWQLAGQPFSHLPHADHGWLRKTAREVHRWASGSLGVSISATLVSTPLAIAYFGVFAPGAILANVLLVPLAGLVVTAGFCSTLASLLPTAAVSSFFNHAALATLATMEAVVAVGALAPGFSWPAAFADVRWAFATVASLLGLLLVGYARGWRPVRFAFWAPIAGLGAALIFGVTFTLRS